MLIKENNNTVLDYFTKAISLVHQMRRNAEHFQKVIHGYGFIKDEDIKEQTINTH